ncbi:MAG: invasion associated locus B family protein [Rhodobacteraceae bacterium]|nr:invasion associated locus B family protein [Paracoccaceae bacterium]
MIAAAFMAGTAPAQEFRDWTLDRDGNACTVSTRVLLRSTGTLLVAVSLSARGAEGALMAVEVPVGASLRDRVAYIHGPGTPERALEWQFCTPDTCLAVAELDQAALHALKRGTRITVGFRPLPSSPVLAAPVSLMGLTRAWEALAACGDG